MDDYVEPVVRERPLRGREMKTDIIPTDMFDTMKLVSAKKTLREKSLVPELAEPSSKSAELYHEGYIDGKLYLVPDSNLQAMKDMINFKMKPRRSSRYKHQTSFELTDYDHFRGKLHSILEKIEEIESESDEEGGGEEEEEEQAEEEEEEEKAKEEEQKVEEERFPVDHDPNHLRFLISGHFRKDQKPIYIIQDFKGGPDLFKEQKADFYTKQKKDDFDLTINGRFYNERILEESQGKPKALNIKPHRILIDEKTSNVYDKYFKQVYKFNSVDITLKGEFIKSKITEKITPFLTVDVKQKHPAEPNIRSEREDNYYRTPSTAVLVYKPESDNPFAKGDDNYHAYTAGDYQDVSDTLLLQSSIAVLTPLLKTEPNCTDVVKTDNKIHHSQGNYENDLKAIVSVKP